MQEIQIIQLDVNSLVYLFQLQLIIYLFQLKFVYMCNVVGILLICQIAPPGKIQRFLGVDIGMSPLLNFGVYIQLRCSNLNLTTSKKVQICYWALFHQLNYVIAATSQRNCVLKYGQ